MPQNTSFAIIYKGLLDCHFSPDPDRAEDALNQILRQLSAEESQKKEETVWNSGEARDMMKTKKRDR